MNVPKKDHLSPLFVIFEQHLLNFSDAGSDRKTFIAGVVKEYILYLRKNQIAVPHALESLIVEELSDQVNTMLVKKIYGCLTIDEFRNNVNVQSKKRARSRYQRIAKRTG